MKYIKYILVLVLLIPLTGCKEEEVDKGNTPIFTGAKAIELHYPYEEELDLTSLVSLFDVEDGSIDVLEDFIDDSELDLDTIGSYSIYYTYTDSDGNIGEYTLTINIVDRVGPIVSLVGERHVFLIEGDIYTEQGVNISDNYDDTCEIIISGDEVKTNIPGTYYIDYSCTDSNGNPSNVITRTVEVVQTIPFDYQIGDKIFFTGYYLDSNNKQQATSGLFYVRDYDQFKSDSVALSIEKDAEIFWVNPSLIHSEDYIDTITTVSLDVGLLHQFDYSGYLRGSDMTISGYGCALTAVTMVINYWNNTTLTPEDTNPDIVQSGLVYWVNTRTEEYENLENHYFPSYEAYRQIKQFSNTNDYNLLKQRVKEKLDEGIPVIINISGNTTHYVVGYGYYYDTNGELNILINDPGSSYRFELDDVTLNYPFFFEGFIYYTK